MKEIVAINGKTVTKWNCREMESFTKGAIERVKRESAELTEGIEKGINALLKLKAEKAKC